jgi:DNA sulfur modification protein DndB
MTKPTELVLPALRGIMGDWIYYTCLVSIDQIAGRISFAKDIHKIEKLSQMIQRDLNKGRIDQISSYLRNQDERFFNSLVVATYGGQPNWNPIDSLNSNSKVDFLEHMTEETINSVGFLSLSGKEKLFAIDGQHRLAGIKKAVQDGLDQDPPDDLSVIFVAHKKSPEGLQRTRRLFTTLNKTAKPVSKGDIIALDEDDVMAITVRRLIEESSFFGEDKIAFVASNNLPATNFTSLTTIGNLYDTLLTLFTKFDTELKKRKAELQVRRPSDKSLNEYYELAIEYFELLGENFPALQEFFDASVPKNAVKKHRGNHGGNALYRPLGLAVLTEIIAKLSHEYELRDAVELVASLPTTLSEPPFLGLMWDPSSKRIVGSNMVTLREVLLYMVEESKYSDPVLLARYRTSLGDEDAELPDQVI